MQRRGQIICWLVPKFRRKRKRALLHNESWSEGGCSILSGNGSVFILRMKKLRGEVAFLKGSQVGETGESNFANEFGTGVPVVESRRRKVLWKIRKSKEFPVGRRDREGKKRFRCAGRRHPTNQYRYGAGVGKSGWGT